MKNAITFLLVMALGFTARAQYEPTDTWKYKLDFSMRYNYIESSYRLSVQPGFIFSSGKSNIRLAPILQLFSTEAANDPDRLRLTGFSTIYRLQIPSARKFTELFFKYEGTGQWFLNRWTAFTWDDDLKVYQPFEYKTTEFFSSHTVGYGFNLNFKQFYIYHTAAAGIYFSRVTGDGVKPNAPQLERLDFRGYDDFGVNYTITLGAGYKFPVKKDKQ